MAAPAGATGAKHTNATAVMQASNAGRISERFTKL
jgi:hypothetical protein